MWVPIQFKREKNPYTTKAAWKPREGWYVFDTKLMKVVHADRLFETKRLCWMAIMGGTKSMIKNAHTCAPEGEE